MNRQAPRRLVRSFHVAVKPIGSRCNIDCTYCYYLHKQGLLGDKAASPIADDLLEEFIRQYIAGQDVDSVVFTWHGGEPTLLGLDFYRKVAELQQKYANGKRIENDLQTNGILLNEAWCEFLKEHAFLVGLSIDGPKHLHDRYRITRRGESTFDGTLRGVRLLQQFEVPFNTMTVVNSVNAKHPGEVYRFLTRELGSDRLQWLPCVEPKDFQTVAPGKWDRHAMPLAGTSAARPGHRDSVVTDWSVDPDDWGTFLCDTFDVWYQNDLGKVFVNIFESLVGQWANKPAQLCTMAEVCGRCVAVEKDGSVLVRPLCLSGVPAGQSARPRPPTRRHDLFARAAEVRLQQARHADRLLQRVHLPLRLQRRLPQEPLHQDPRRPARPELPLLGHQAIPNARRPLSPRYRLTSQTGL
jgi:uncharacterized protein